jgi:peptide deformylase
MKTVNDLLVLGNPILYEISDEVMYDELSSLKNWVQDLHEVMEDIRVKYNFGRAIAAPQLGITYGFHKSKNHQQEYRNV